MRWLPRKVLDRINKINRIVFKQVGQEIQEIRRGLATPVFLLLLLFSMLNSVNLVNPV